MQRVGFDGANAELERAEAFLMQEPDCIPRTAVCEGFVEECTPRWKASWPRLDAVAMAAPCGHVWAV